MANYLRKCVDCELEAITVDDLELFSKGNESKHGRQNICKSCENRRTRESDRIEYNKEYARRKRKEKCPKFLKAERRCYLKRHYNITIEEYDDMVLHHNNECAICGKSSDKKLHIDHCHDTGVIRGLLCGRCNTGLGLFKDNKENLTNAIKYLELTKQEVSLL